MSATALSGFSSRTARLALLVVCALGAAAAFACAPRGSAVAYAHAAAGGCTTPLFGPPAFFALGNEPGDLDSADFNHDSNLDLVVTIAQMAYVVVLYGDGAGGFGSSDSVPIAGGGLAVAAADFNHDGNADLVVTNQSGPNVQVLLGDGEGGFGPPLDLQAGALPFSVAAADLNNDGHPDFLTTNHGSDSISVFLGDGAGDFEGPMHYLTGPDPYTIGLADFNTDGALDLITASQGHFTVMVLYNDGFGGFGGLRHFPAVGGTNAVTVADFDGDDNYDYAAVNLNAQLIVVAMGDGAGNFATNEVYSTGYWSTDIEAGDVNRDASPDLVVSNSGDDDVSVRLNTGTGTFSPRVNFDMGNSPRILHLADFNGDGAPDMAVSNTLSNNVSVRLNLCEVGTPTAPSPTLTPSATRTSTAPTPSATTTATAPPSSPTPPASTPTACAVEFADVPPNHTFYSYVRCLACQGIVSGYPDDTFRPDRHVTRGQLAKVVSNAARFLEDPNPQMFEDVPPSNPFYMWVNRLARRGHMEGYPCGGSGEPCITEMPYFRPFAGATRGQAAKIVANAAEINDPVSGQTFEDVPPDHTFYLWVERLAARGVMAGYACGGPGEPCGPGDRPYFRPQNGVTRGQASKIVANTFFPGCSP